MKTLLKVLALIAAIPLTVVVMPWAMYGLGVYAVGFGFYAIGKRLITGRWPKGRQAPEPEGLSDRERLAFYAVMGNENAQYMCDQLNKFEQTGNPSVFL